MKNYIENSVIYLAAAAEGNPVTTTCVVGLFFLFFNILEATVEKLLFGERLEHWLDPIFVLCFIAYSAYAVMGCAIYNRTKEQLERAA